MCPAPDKTPEDTAQTGLGCAIVGTLLGRINSISIIIMEASPTPSKTHTRYLKLHEQNVAPLDGVVFLKRICLLWGISHWNHRDVMYAVRKKEFKLHVLGLGRLGLEGYTAKANGPASVVRD